MKQPWHKKTVQRKTVGIVPSDKTAARKGRVKSGWHASPKSEMQIRSERMKKNSW